MDLDQRNSIKPEFFDIERRNDLHLDAEYSQHWLIYHLNDGRMVDSRLVNWNHVEWEKIAQISIHLKGKSYLCPPHPRNHQFFVHYRTHGMLKEWRDNHWIPKLIRLWTVGVCDGQNAFLIDYDFHYGTEVMAHVRTIAEIEGHIHPRIRALNSIQDRYVSGGNVVNLLTP